MLNQVVHKFVQHEFLVKVIVGVRMEYVLKLLRRSEKSAFAAFMEVRFARQVKVVVPIERLFEDEVVIEESIRMVNRVVIRETNYPLLLELVDGIIEFVFANPTFHSTRAG